MGLGNYELRITNFMTDPVILTKRSIARRSSA